MTLGTGYVTTGHSKYSWRNNRTGGVMVSVLSSCVVDHGFEPLSGQNKDYEINIFCFSAMHASLRRKNNVSKWGDMSIRGVLFQWASTKQIQLSVLV